jgi:hypothetical protein
MQQDNPGELDKQPAQSPTLETGGDTPTRLPLDEVENPDVRGGADGKAKALGKPGLGDHVRPNRENE